jgi:hypothetical protein
MICIFYIDLKFGHKLLKIFHFLLKVVVVMVEFIIFFSQHLPFLLGQFQILLHLLQHPLFIDISLGCFLLHQLLVAEGVVLVLRFNLRTLLLHLLLLVLALAHQHLHLSLLFGFELLDLFQVLFDVELLLVVELVSLFIELSNFCQFFLFQSVRLIRLIFE